MDTWLDTCSDIDHSTSTRTASEAEMYRTFDDDDEVDRKSIDSITKPNSCKFIHCQ